MRAFNLVYCFPNAIFTQTEPSHVALCSPRRFLQVAIIWSRDMELFCSCWLLFYDFFQMFLNKLGLGFVGEVVT